MKLGARATAFRRGYGAKLDPHIVQKLDEMHFPWNMRDHYLYRVLLPAVSLFVATPRPPRLRDARREILDGAVGHRRRTSLLLGPLRVQRADAAVARRSRVLRGDGWGLGWSRVRTDGGAPGEVRSARGGGATRAGQVRGRDGVENAPVGGGVHADARCGASAVRAVNARDDWERAQKLFINASPDLSCLPDLLSGVVERGHFVSVLIHPAPRDDRDSRRVSRRAYPEAPRAPAECRVATPR